MLIQFRVENHRSLCDEQVLSMVAAPLGDTDDARLRHSPGLNEALLPALVLYGANASGKSNVLGAVAFMRRTVLESYRLWEPERDIPQEPFVLSNKACEPSLYEVDILVDGVRYRYGFVLSANRVEEEWLHAWPHGRKQVWFERESDEFEFGKHLRGENETIRGLTRANSLFLSVAAQNNHAALIPIFRWFQSIWLELRRDQGRAMTVSREIGSEREAIVRLLRAADVGILDLKVDHGVRRSRRSVPGFYASDRHSDIRLLHGAENKGGVWLPLEVESSGTVILLGLAMTLAQALRDGLLVCIDDLEANLHSMLVLALVRLFNDPVHNPRGAQLIFATHDTCLLGNVLGDSPLRRDQIWFTEKDRKGATRVYPLTDFHPRKEENLERGYLQGRYGAIPVLGSLVQHPDGLEQD